MKTLQNNFTTPEQSKRLLELGVPADSADCYFEKCTGDICIIKKGTFSTFCDKSEFPCWSVGRLIKILKISIIDKNELREIFDELEMCIDETAVLVQAFKEFGDLTDFSKLEE